MVTHSSSSTTASTKLNESVGSKVNVGDIGLTGADAVLLAETLATGSAIAQASSAQTTQAVANASTAASDAVIASQAVKNPQAVDNAIVQPQGSTAAAGGQGNPNLAASGKSMLDSTTVLIAIGVIVILLAGAAIYFGSKHHATE